MAYVNLGVLYENGYGVNQSNKKAFEYYLKAKETVGIAGICNAYRLLELELVNSNEISKENLINEAKTMGIDCVKYIEP